MAGHTACTEGARWAGGRDVQAADIVEQKDGNPHVGTVGAARGIGRCVAPRQTNLCLSRLVGSAVRYPRVLRITIGKMYLEITFRT